MNNENIDMTGLHVAFSRKDVKALPAMLDEINRAQDENGILTPEQLAFLMALDLAVCKSKEIGSTKDDPYKYDGPPIPQALHCATKIVNESTDTTKAILRQYGSQASEKAALTLSRAHAASYLASHLFMDASEMIAEERTPRR